MTPQEQELLTGLIDRLRQAGPQPKDPDAEALIRRAIAAQPDIPYLLAQSVLVQDFALTNAHNRIQELEAKLAEAQSARPAPAAAGSFLGGMAGGRGSVPAVGPWASRAPATAPAAQPMQAAQPGPMMAPNRSAPAAPPPPQPAAGGGFLRQAMATAAGVAGGALLFQGIQSMFSGHGNPAAAATAPGQPAPTQAAAQPAAPAPVEQAQAEPQDPGYADANYGQDYAQDMTSDGEDYGADMGGGDSDMF